MSSRVAAAGAEYFEEATAEAVTETVAVRKAMQRAAQAPQQAAAQLDAAKKSLLAARDAYRRAEATVFFVDPESLEELRAQPDPMHAGSSAPESSRMQDVAASLDKMDELLQQPLDEARADALLAEAGDLAEAIDELEAGLRGLAEAWEDGNGDNFRSAYFLSSPPAAVARVFQGLLALSGDVLPGKLADEANEPSEISARVAAMKEVYLGGDADSADSVSLHALVQQASPVQAALTRASLARSSALAGVLELSPQDAQIRQQLDAALADTTRQLTSAARSLGIVIVESHQP